MSRVQELVACQRYRSLFQSADGGKTWRLISGIAAWFKNVVIDPRNGPIYAGE
jgi:hypothetical protein